MIANRAGTGAAVEGVVPNKDVAPVRARLQSLDRRAARTGTGRDVKQAGVIRARANIALVSIADVFVEHIEAGCAVHAVDRGDTARFARYSTKECRLLESSQRSKEIEAPLPISMTTSFSVPSVARGVAPGGFCTGS